MRPTPISREIIDRAIDEYGIIDYANATIREVKAIAERAERESGQEFIKMEMGIPGLPAAKIGVEAQIKALQNGCARLYPALPGEPMIKDATSRFIKAFIDIDIPAECCIPTVGSMQGTFASLLTITQSNKKKNKALFIDPGFPVQKLQLEIQDVPYETFDIYEFRGKKLRAKLEENRCAATDVLPHLRALRTQKLNAPYRAVRMRLAVRHARAVTHLLLDIRVGTVRTE